MERNGKRDEREEKKETSPPTYQNPPAVKIPSYKIGGECRVVDLTRPTLKILQPQKKKEKCDLNFPCGYLVRTLFSLSFFEHP